MEFSLDDQVLRPIHNEVEVLNGESYRDFVLHPRIKPLLEARTVQGLLDVLEPVKQSLETFGTKPEFIIRPASKNTRDLQVISLRTVVDLTNVRPHSSLQLSSRAYRDLYNIEGRWQKSNMLGLGELSEFSAQLQPKPYSLAAGSFSMTSPLPLGRGLVQLKGFFFNEDRIWSSYSLATHGISASLQVPWIASFIFKGGAQAVARNVHSISEGASDIVRAAAGSSSLKVSAIAQLTHSGVYHSAKAFVEAAGTPGDSQHLKTIGTVSYNFPLSPGEELLLSLKGKLGYIHSYESQPNLCDNFLIGGPQDLLGFKRFSVGPRDGSDFIGGQAFYTSRVALLGKIPLKALSPLRLKTQVDAGVLKAHSSKDIKTNLKNLLNESVVISTAAGLTYQTKKANFDVLYVFPVKSSGTDIRESGLHISAELHLM